MKNTRTFWRTREKRGWKSTRWQIFAAPNKRVFENGAKERRISTEGNFPCEERERESWENLSMQTIKTRQGRGEFQGPSNERLIRGVLFIAWSYAIETGLFAPLALVVSSSKNNWFSPSCPFRIERLVTFRIFCANETPAMLLRYLAI